MKKKRDFSPLAKPRKLAGEDKPVPPGPAKWVGKPLKRRSARIAQPQHPRPLVERLARRIVERAAENLKALALPNVREQRVTTAGDQAYEWRLESALLGSLVGRG